jgi:predicted nucleic acid-binding protein
MRFVDTNVLLYAVSTAPAEAAKAGAARGLLEADDLALSVQVIRLPLVRSGALRVKIGPP